MKRIGKDKIISELQDCYEKHGFVNRATFNEDGDYSSGKTVYNYFGSFSKACEVADVPHNNKPQKKDKIVVECENCSETIELYPYRLEQSENNRFFCDHECQGDWWSDNISGKSHPLYKGYSNSIKFGKRWHIIREQCLERDYYMCRFCGLTQQQHISIYERELEVHHIIPRRQFYEDEDKSVDGTNSMENLITLCREHHIQAENGIIKLENE
jgi:hypothetical protein